MSDQTKGRKPDFHAVQPIESGKGDNKRTYWQQVGAAWLLEDKEGMRVVLHSFPVSGEFVLMPPKPEGAQS